jgi:hypothetical protein
VTHALGINAFDEDGNGSPDESFGEKAALGFPDFNEGMQPFLFYRFFNLPGQGVGTRSASPTVREYMKITERQVPNQLHRIFKRPVILARKPHDDVGAQPQEGYLFDGHRHGAAKGIGVVAATHGREDAVIAALQGDVEELAQFGRVGHVLDDGLFCCGDLKGAQADTGDGGKGFNVANQIGEAAGAILITAEVRAGKDDFPESGGGDPPDFIKNFDYGAATGNSPRGGNNAIGAMEVAAVLNFDQGSLGVEPGC